MQYQTKYETKRGRRKIQWGRIALLLVLLVALCTAGYLLYQQVTKSKVPTELRTSQNENAQSILESDENLIIAVHYPQTGSGSCDKLLKSKLETEISAFKETYKEYKAASKEERMILFMDYTPAKSGDSYQSYAFYKAVSSSTTTLSKELFATYSYDVKQNQEVQLDTLFQGAYLEKIAALVRQSINHGEYHDARDLSVFYHNTKAETENYPYFLLNDTKLTVLLNSKSLLKEDKGILTVSVSLNDLRGYLRNPVNASETITPTATDENPARYIDPDKPMIALTYDDGPYTPVTSAILDILKEYKGAATFFVVGSRVDTYHEIMERAIDQGCEIGNHSNSHAYLPKLSVADMLKELSDMEDKVTGYVSNYDMKLMRPTFGAYDEEMQANVPYVMINWSIDTLDWKTRDSAQTYQNVMNNVRDGDIILMHDLYTASGEATVKLVPELSKSYQLVTVSELLEYKGIEAKNGQVYLSTYMKAR